MKEGEEVVKVRRGRRHGEERAKEKETKKGKDGIVGEREEGGVGSGMGE